MNRNVRKSNVEDCWAKQHSDHKAVCDRKSADMAMATRLQSSSVNSQPSAVDGLKRVLRPIPQGFRISERLGHESAVITLGTYAHLYPDKQNEVAARLEAFA